MMTTTGPVKLCKHCARFMPIDENRVLLDHTEMFKGVLCIGASLDQLLNILNTMNIPENRKWDFHWINRNLHFQNSKHKDYNEARRLLKIVMKGNK